MILVDGEVVAKGEDISMVPLRSGRSLRFKQEEKDTIREIKGGSGVRSLTPSRRPRWC